MPPTPLALAVHFVRYTGNPLNGTLYATGKSCRLLVDNALHSTIVVFSEGAACSHNPLLANSLPYQSPWHSYAPVYQE